MPATAWAHGTGMSALTPNGSPRRLYAEIGRLHRGFRAPVALPSGSGLVVGQLPPVPIPGGFSITPCPESG